jgi:hypothetical protein
VTTDQHGRSLLREVGCTTEGVGFICTDVGAAVAEPASVWDRSTASMVFDRAESRPHTTKAAMVATVGD